MFLFDFRPGAQRAPVDVHRRVAWCAATAAIALTSLLTLTAPDADAWRLPSARERSAIKAASMRHCRETQPGGCRWLGGVMVSTTDPRYAWAASGGDAYGTAGIVSRPTARSERWRVKRVVGGGAQPCSWWTSVAPGRVVGEFGLEGFRLGSDGTDFTRAALLRRHRGVAPAAPSNTKSAP